ncbi:MAG: 50S ribosomal protein L1, partial [Candidatus Hydrothermota bacterium]
QSFRGTYIKAIHISPTMGPSVEIDVNDVLRTIESMR